jgi:hypothetical protein
MLEVVVEDQEYHGSTRFALSAAELPRSIAPRNVGLNTVGTFTFGTPDCTSWIDAFRLRSAVLR